MNELVATFQPGTAVSGVRERVMAVFEEAFSKNLYLHSDSQLMQQAASGLDEEAQSFVKERGGIRQLLLGDEMRGAFTEAEGILFMTRDSDAIRQNVLDSYPSKDPNGQVSPNADKPRIISEATKRALSAELTQTHPRGQHPRRVTFREPPPQLVTSRGAKFPQRSLSSCVSAAPFFPKDHRPPNQANSFYIPRNAPGASLSPPFQPTAAPNMSPLFGPSSAPYAPPPTATPLFSSIPMPSVHHQGGMWSPTVPGPNPERIVDSVLKGEEMREHLTEFKAELRRLESQLEMRGREAKRREEEMSALRSQLTESEAQLREAREWGANTQKELEKERHLCRELKARAEESQRERTELADRATQAERRVLSFHRDRAVDHLQREIAELDKLVTWTELNPNTKAHALQLRAHIGSVRDLAGRVCEQFQAQLEQLERGVPLSKLEYIASEIPSRPLPPVYLPTEREYPLPHLATSPPPPTGATSGTFAQPRYGPQVSAAAAQTDGREDAQTRLVRKLSNWHPELTETELFGYISRAKQERSGHSFSGMTLNEILSCVHDVISRERKYGVKQTEATAAN